MPLVSLAPRYRPEHHQVYLDLLERALRDPDTRSVALTGSYGSGKSSVLHALGRPYLWDRRFPWRRRRRVIELSLSTLDPRAEPSAPPENPAERERSNRIQKELVKQLLYRLPPGRTPHSRFPRATSPAFSFPPVFAALAVVGLAWAATALVGWQATIDQRLSELGWSAAWFWGGVGGGLVVLVLAAWRMLAGRYALQAGLKAGSLTVSLEPRSTSYFDQYLDEILYFFQVSRTDVVLIEDVDRFDDAVVFDTLRALNVLVNSSGQVGRRVVFVYAIRDSVLGLIGASHAPDAKNGNTAGATETAPTTAAPAGTMSQLDRANRAKHFDVIIPIVPFVTADNARDLMLKVMAPHVSDAKDKPGISPALIRLAARHVADMRTLWSLRNEYEIHYDRLVTSAKTAAPEISPDIVFSLVLLRATSPDAYENIRLATSPLDTLTRRWLKLVEDNLATQTGRLTKLTTQLENGQSLDTRAALAGRKLDDLRPELQGLAPGFTAARVEFTVPLTDANLADLSGWQQIADGSSQMVNLIRPQSAYGQPTHAYLQLDSKMLAHLLGMKIDPQAWQEADLDDLRGDIAKTLTEIALLRHYTWSEFYKRVDLSVDPEGSEQAGSTEEVNSEDPDPTHKSGQVNFADLVSAYAPTPLARELIANGYLTRNFARYASMFYGIDISLNATEYIARAIEPGTPILEFELKGSEVDQILRAQKADADDASHLFDEPAIYNLDIVRYLLTHRLGPAQRVAKHLAERWGEQEQTLVGRFFGREQPELVGKLAALMAPKWAQALRYTAVDAPVTPQTRLHLVNVVLRAIGAGERTDLDTEVAQYLSEHYQELQAVTRPADEQRATIVMTVFAAAGATIDDLGVLNKHAVKAASQTTIYPITATNLQALGGASLVALDTLQAKAPTQPVYEHAVNHLEDYLQALPQMDPAATPVADPGRFADILNDIAAKPQATLLEQFIAATSNACRVPDLGQTEADTWPALVAQKRTDPTIGNVQRYLTEYGVDDDLGAFLTEHGAIEAPEGTPQPDRLTLATELIAARGTLADPAVRVTLAASVTPGLIPIGHVAPEVGNLIGPLLEAGLLADEPETFDPGRLGRWEHFEDAVAASGAFGTFADITTMPAQHLAPTLMSGAIPEDTRSALVTKVASLISGATPEQATAIADALANRRDLLDLPRLQALHEADASNPSLVRVIVAQGQALSIGDLRAILELMGDDYTRVSRGNWGSTVRFSVDDDHRALLSRLEGVTHTGAKEATTKAHGTRLKATLRRPPE